MEELIEKIQMVITSEVEVIKLLSKENKQLKKNIDKAINKLKIGQQGLEEWHFDGFDPDLEGIIQILKGGDNEQKVL